MVLSVLMKARHMTSPELKKRSFFLVKTRSNSTFLPCRNDFTAPKLVSLPTGPSRLLRNAFFNQKGRASTPRDSSRPPRAPGNEAIAMRGRTILITTRASAKRASRPHSLATRSNKSTKGDRQKSEPDAMPVSPLAAPRAQRACPSPIASRRRGAGHMCYARRRCESARNCARRTRLGR